MTAQATDLGIRIASSLNAKARNAGMDVPQHFQKFGQERLLARLFDGPEAAHMMTTGGMMWQIDPDVADLGRSTSDIDLQIFRAAKPEGLVAFAKRACARDLGDGVVFEVRKAQMLEHTDLDQPGVRVHIVGHVGKTRVTTHVDFCFAPKPCEVRTLVPEPMVAGQKAVPVVAQTWASSIADKLHSVVARGLKNTRLKDYRDLYVFAQRGHAADPKLQDAIAETFSNRGTALPNRIPVGLDLMYAQYRQEDWDNYLAKLSPKQREGLPADLSDVTYALEEAYMPALVPTDELDEVFALRA